MEARLCRAVLLFSVVFSLGAASRTTNFVVNAPTPELAKAIADAAEKYRRDLAIEWLGHELPAWSQPCPIRAQVAPHLGAGGATSFMFERGRPFGWRMNIQGPRTRILDSVLPHEVTHTIFATHFGRPLPRWADEGACTTVEHDAEKNKQQQMLIRFLTWQPYSRGIPFNQMFAMKEYPRDILPLYAQGYSVARYLIGLGGKRKFVDYVGEGMKTNNWPATTQRYYGFRSLGELQATWLAWVGNGSPTPQSPLQENPDQVEVAANTEQQQPPVFRAQNADDTRSDERASQNSSSLSTSPQMAAVVPDRAKRDESGSWYVRQNEKSSGRKRYARASRDVFHPVDLSEVLPEKPAVAPRTRPAKDPSRKVLLEWSQTKENSRPPVRFDAPLPGKNTVWR